MHVAQGRDVAALSDVFFGITGGYATLGRAVEALNLVAIGNSDRLAGLSQRQWLATNSMIAMVIIGRRGGLSFAPSSGNLLLS